MSVSDVCGFWTGFRFDSIFLRKSVSGSDGLGDEGAEDDEPVVDMLDVELDEVEHELDVLEAELFIA